MRIGLVSDTHGVLRPEVPTLFQGVDHILHAGDVGLPSVLTDLATIAPVTAVWGNTDSFDVRALTAASIELELNGVVIGLAHGHLVSTFDQLAEVSRERRRLFTVTRTYRAMIWWTECGC